MVIVLDCNILVMSLTSKSPYHRIFQSLVLGKFDLAINEEILLEYEEIIQLKYGTRTAASLIALLKELPNVRFTNTYYRWNLIEADPEDNKYVDCAINSGASFLVTEDKHFSILASIPFPKLSVLSINGFLKMVDTEM
ncbi:putative toxin-antitoxin system toxin component, PIN family [Algoriphagus sp.]|uniref:putative toxin-antitoxin system toxin component, PIN family n=1 Tax=Algoriphagus sp. TaxID=1872435 RepID=UPI003919742F